MKQDPFFQAALAQRGISQAEAEAQLAHFVRGVKPTRLLRPATIGDGIQKLDSTSVAAHAQRFAAALRSGLKPLRMVPASGAASRMFEALSAHLSDGQKADRAFSKEFIENIRSLALWPRLEACAKKDDIYDAKNK